MGNGKGVVLESQSPSHEPAVELARVHQGRECTMVHHNREWTSKQMYSKVANTLHYCQTLYFCSGIASFGLGQLLTVVSNRSFLPVSHCSGENSSYPLVGGVCVKGADSLGKQSTDSEQRELVRNTKESDMLSDQTRRSGEPFFRALKSEPALPAKSGIKRL